MGWFSAVKSVATAVKTGAKISTAPTSLAVRAIVKVAPKPIGSLAKKVGGLTPAALISRAAPALISRAAPTLIKTALKVTPAAIATRAAINIVKPRVMPAVKRASAPIARMAPIVARAASRGAPPRAAAPFSMAPPVGIFSRVAAAVTSPTASPNSGQTLSPAAVQAIAAGGVPDRASLGPRGGGGASDEGYDGGDYPGGGDSDPDYPVGGDESDPYGNDEAGTSSPGGYDEDPTADLPDGFLDPRGGDDAGAGGSYMEGVDYHAALSDSEEIMGLGDWKSDLANFGKTAALTVGKQALTQIGTKLTGGAKVPPPVAAGMSMATKIAIGAVIALPIGYLALRGRRSPVAA